MTDESGLYFLLISVHGLIRGEDLELGRDADTGGQCKYVVELLRALAQRPDVRRADLLTRSVVDPDVSEDYSKHVEILSEKARIVRIDAGPEGYIRKEELWDHLDNFADNALNVLRDSGETPDIVHSHYADAGYVGSRISSQLGVPLIHTGHSLGRVKRRHLLAGGMKRDAIEERYNMVRRIEAEEDTLAAAELVITSTNNEIDEQYGRYDHYQPEQMVVIPPGTNLEQFHPVSGDEEQTTIAADLRRFLQEPEKPIILALSRPDERKNVSALVEAYGESTELQRIANLVIVVGNRDDIREMESGPQRVLAELLLLIDRYDLYGKVAYPKHHQADEAPIFYRLAASSRGVFVNPALTEPFGLTLLEAAASGLPVVSTEDGGPQDIIAHCQNGLLVDPTDTQAIERALLEVLQDAERWDERSKAGIEGVRQHYSWEAHAKRYLANTRPLLEAMEPLPKAALTRRPMLYHDRAVFTDLDQNLLGDREAIAELANCLRDNRKSASFGIATGRRLDSALKVIKAYGIPLPDVLITSVGTEIYYAPQLAPDMAWARHIDHLWTPKAVRRALAEVPGLKRQETTQQSLFKISYYFDPQEAPPIEEIHSLLHQADQTVNVFFSFGQFLDITPVRASKGFAIRYFADKWDIPLEHILAAGGSGTDEDMLLGNTLAVVVANRHDEELSHLPDVARIYYSESAYARGILEAMDHYDFYGRCESVEGESDVQT